MKRIAIIIPAYNEAKNIAQVVKDVHNIKSSLFKADPIVVNDCSTDATAFIVEKLDCVLLNLPFNLGIGGAVQTGYKYASINEYDYAIQVDGDGQHPVDAIELLFKEISENNVDVVIGSRFITKEGFQSSLLRRFGIQYFQFLNKILLGIIITDCTSGFRMVTKDVVSVLCDYYPDDYPEPEAIVLFNLQGFLIKEIPVMMKERQGGVSSINFVSSIYYMVKVTLAIFYTFIRIKSRK